MRKVRRAEARSALMQLMQQQERFYSQVGNYMVFDWESTNTNAQKFKWYSGATAASSAYEIKGGACSDTETARTCIKLTATAGTAKVNPAYSDPVCGVISLSSNGDKTPDPATTPKCW